MGVHNILGTLRRALQLKHPQALGKLGVAFICSQNDVVELEILYARTLRLMGYRCVFLMRSGSKKKDISIVRRYGFSVVFLEDVGYSCIASNNIPVVNQLLEQAEREGPLDIEYKGISLGRYAAATVLRKTRGSSIQLANQKDRELYDYYFRHAFQACEVAADLDEEYRPQLVLFCDRVYVPGGVLFEYFVKNGIQCITHNAAQLTGFHVLKRYLSMNDVRSHPHSLSDRSWQYLCNRVWREQDWAQLKSSIKDAYLEGDWFAEVGTQFGKKIVHKDVLRKKLGLDESRKTVCVFPHMFWDGTFGYGTDLFTDYHDWFVNVLRCAGANDSLNWLVKIHPANTVKAKRDGVVVDHSEIVAIRDVLGETPNHITVIHSDDDVSTYSLFSVIDYALTVRGTVGIEAAAFGVRTLTAGTGRFDGRGFTLDFDDVKDYKSTLMNLSEVKAMSIAEIDLARRYAYGVFLCRLIDTTSVLSDVIQHDDLATREVKMIIKSEKMLAKSLFYDEFQRYVLSNSIDYLRDSVLDTAL